MSHRRAYRDGEALRRQAAWALYESNPQAEQLDLFQTNDRALLMVAEYNALANMKTGTHDDIVGREQGGSWLYPLTQIPFTPASLFFLSGRTSFFTYFSLILHDS